MVVAFPSISSPAANTSVMVYFLRNQIVFVARTKSTKEKLVLAPPSSITKMPRGFFCRLYALQQREVGQVLHLTQEGQWY